MLAAIALWTLPRFIPLSIEVGNDKACWCDLDGDGWTDLVAGGATYRNEEGKGFKKLGEGYGAVVAADYDNDGDIDLFSYSNMKLYANDGKFQFRSMPLPELPATVSRAACWSDLNHDGWVDLYVSGFEDWDKGITYPNLTLMNRKGQTFELVNVDGSSRSRGVTACDFDQDGTPEVYVSNYRLQPNQLFCLGSSDLAPAKGVVATSPGFEGGHSIGACWGDFDDDGQFDLFAGNFAHVDSRGDQPKSRFYRQNKGVFEDLGTGGVWYQESYASPAAADVDNDGWLDLFFTTVYGAASFGKPNFSVLYRNPGKLPMVDVTEGSGLEKLPPTYQAAFAEFENRGAVGLCAGGKIFRSTNVTGHWLSLSLEGDGKTVNRSAIGAQVRVRLKDRTITRQVEAGTGEGNQNDLKLHLGLGEVKGKVDVDVFWPGGKKQRVRGLRVDQSHRIRFRS